MAKRGSTVDDYIAVRNEPVQAVLCDLRALVRDALPGAAEGMKYGAPVFFDLEGAVRIYLYGGEDHAHLGIIGADGFDDPEGLLEGRGGSRHVVIRPDHWPPREALAALLKQCVGMD